MNISRRRDSSLDLCMVYHYVDRFNSSCLLIDSVGIPISLKDQIDIKGIESTIGAVHRQCMAIVDSAKHYHL